MWGQTEECVEREQDHRIFPDYNHSLKYLLENYLGLEKREIEKLTNTTGLLLDRLCQVIPELFSSTKNDIYYTQV